MSDITPSRGYLVKALFDWIVDNGLTPHLVVAAEVPGTAVPDAYVKDGQITLNISPSAVRDLFMDTEAVSFNARFGGVPMQVYVPAAAILAIFARENGQGMGFGMEPGADLLQAQVEAALETGDPTPPAEPEPTKDEKPKKPGLRVVK
ncbi:MAG TPA: ClpXP protease specificity-enhancing factor [Marinobacterium sp.]|nr:ClpXP protease specificity-enhancing factor [Marinobacterium sp.]